MFDQKRNAQITQEINYQVKVLTEVIKDLTVRWTQQNDKVTLSKQVLQERTPEYRAVVGTLEIFKEQKRAAMHQVLAIS